MKKFSTAYVHFNENLAIAQNIKATTEIDAMKQAILRQTASTQKKSTKEWLDGIEATTKDEFKAALVESSISVDAVECY